MKSVLISIQPKWCELIASSKKTVEVWKTRPKLDTPFKVYIYCTLQGSNEFFQSLKNRLGEYEALSKWNREKWGLKKGKVIGEFICDKIVDIDYGIEEGVYFDGEYQEGFETNGNGDNPTCLSLIDLESYLTKNEGYGWHISDLVIYDKPKELSEFYTETCTSFFNGVCTAPKFECGFQHYVYQGNVEPCVKELTRPPQSWCYVESEVEGE